MIRIGIVGYGNLGRGVERLAYLREDIDIIGIFTRRSPNEVDSLGSKVYSLDFLYEFIDRIDVCILCGGSAIDLPVQTPEITKYFNTIDSFDNHGEIPLHFQRVDKVARKHKKTSIISVGWDPGLFSINRLIGESILPNGQTHTFWGTGVSQGHSDAISIIDGVKYGIQYTIPNKNLMERIMNGEKLNISAGQKHSRLCYVVLKDGVNEDVVEEKIVTMPNYFLGYDTKVKFINEDEFKRNHTGMPHGGMVVTMGNTSDETQHIYEFSLKLDNNPEFTASVNLAYARACYRLAQDGKSGAYTVLDIPPKYLSRKTDLELQRDLL